MVSTGVGLDKNEYLDYSPKNAGAFLLEVNHLFARAEIQLLSWTAPLSSELSESLLNSNRNRITSNRITS